ncbi:TauD/TfdA family dioxygenase [Streptosporangium sp. NBC_01755]|uniref:TauD/TfdA family dioxygenase n=1 Tax=unclassified Streptosporangium TaxID=2632669 RepID=UPI002DD87F9F|nr:MULTISPECIES: TauD/TfdA family dioxygenase [unclassified Streptosporangium]WSA28272.1 TauD/TfdA family dioxygenase [Streptosporangium sp. NBC_01810]WSD00251.1 TauD/TfdA family dioxygenase [Streptosporangium sp. NBC_01755]
MTTDLSPSPITGPSAWRGDELAGSTQWIYLLGDAEREELETLGRRFVEDDPDLRNVAAESYPLVAARGMIEECARQMDAGRGFILVRGLRTEEYGDTLAGAIFFLMGLHLGTPMEQNQLGNVLDHVIATSNKTLDDPGALPSRVRDRLPFHSDSSDVVALMCLRASKEGGSSSLVSGTTIYNEVLRRRPDLAPLLFEPWHWDWRGQDPDSLADTYVSPICSHVDGIFSTYAGSTMIFSAQKYPGVPPLTEAQIELLHLYDEITQEPGLALDMDFQPGDVQWLLNYAALHSRTGYVDWPEPERRRHLLRLWLKRDVGRPLVAGFGKNVVKARGDEEDKKPLPGGSFRISEAVVPNQDWGN